MGGNRQQPQPVMNYRCLSLYNRLHRAFRFVVGRQGKRTPPGGPRVSNPTQGADYTSVGELNPERRPHWCDLSGTDERFLAKKMQRLFKHRSSACLKQGPITFPFKAMDYYRAARKASVWEHKPLPCETLTLDAPSLAQKNGVFQCSHV